MSNDDSTGNDNGWLQRMKERGAVKPYNDDNNKARGRSLHEFKPAPTTNNSTPEQPKPQPPKPSFKDKVKPKPQPTKPSGPKR